MSLTARFPITEYLMDWKLEVVPLPVEDVDIAKEFYTGKLGFVLDHDHSVNENFRVVQLTPPGSACSIVIGKGFIRSAPGSVQGLHLVISDIHAAREELVSRGVEVSDIQDLGGGISSAFFKDPDGNSWVLQEIAGRAGQS